MSARCTPTTALVSHESEDSATLLHLTASGDRLAYAELVRRHQPEVMATCRRILRHREDALDATQETFMKVLLKASTYRGEAVVEGWIHRIAVNTCLDIVRRKRRRQTKWLDDVAEPSDPRSEQGFLAVESGPDLEAALAAFPPWLRTVVELSVDGLRLEDISTVLDVPVGTIKSGMHRARRRAQLRSGWLASPAHVR